MKQKSKRLNRTLCAAAVTAVCAGPASAIELDFDNGWKGSVNTKLGVSAMWRAEDPDKKLIGGDPRVAALMNGGTSAQYLGVGRGFATNVGNLNYGKGDMTTAVAKFLTELQLSKGDTAVMLRAKGWYDYALNEQDTPWGNRAAWNAAGTTPIAQVATVGGAPSTSVTRWNKPLSDKGAPALAQFDGIYLLDAFVSQNIDISDMPGQVRVGRQATNWGEGLFMRGISQVSPIDVAALRRPGTELKEALLPTWSVVANLGLPEGRSLEAFYQLKWEPTVLEYCGSFFGMSSLTAAPDPGQCNSFDFQGGPNPMLGQTSATAASIPLVKGDKPSDAGAWGLQFRFPVDAIDTEFALYAMNISSTLPSIMGRGVVSATGATTNGVGAAVNGGNAVAVQVTTANVRFNYLENIQVYGLSAATNLFGASFGAELSFQKDVPVNYHGNDLNAYLGVNTALREQAIRQLSGSAGQTVEFKGYELHDKTQLIVNSVLTLGEVAKSIGATNGVLVAEVGAEWNDLPDYRKPGAVRFGRGGGGSRYTKSTGVAAAPAAVATNCLATVGTAAQPVPGVTEQWCDNDGFATDFSWGYRLRTSVTYPQIFGTSWSATPSLFFSHDVDGVSMDTQYQEGRQIVGLGLEFDLNKEHTVNFGYTKFSGKWNELADHDNVTFSYTYSF